MGGTSAGPKGGTKKRAGSAIPGVPALGYLTENLPYPSREVV